MFNKFGSTGVHRSLVSYRKNRGTNTYPNILLDYYQQANTDENSPWPGTWPPYEGDPMPNELFQDFVTISLQEYVGWTTYASPKYGSSAGDRLSPQNPARGVVRYRDCSSYIWDILSQRLGFKIGPLWYTASEWQLLKEYQVSYADRRPGDLIVYWTHGGANALGGYSEHTMFYVGGGTAPYNYYLDVTGGIRTACQQRNRYNLSSGNCRFVRIPPAMYPD